MSEPAGNSLPYRTIATLLIVVAVAAVCARILSANALIDPGRYTDPSKWPTSRPEPTATLGGNDRSRWDTIRALVDDGTYAIGHRHWPDENDREKYDDSGIMTEDGWKTVDMILAKNGNFYSTKPPLLPTLLAGEYWLLKHAFG